MKIQFKDSDFRVEYTKGSGPGGQHRNKVETACTVTHIATGIKQRCQSTRSKTQNHEIALKAVKSKVTALMQKKNKDKFERIKADAIYDDSNGSLVIRTYNYKRNEVKDHRIGAKANLQSVLDGDLELLR